jgi:glycosyltransferase involved in cell wall biosynthesis
VRILFYLQSLNQGGSERNVADLAHGLTRRGHDVAVAAVHQIGEHWQQVLDPDLLPVSIFFHDTPRNLISTASQLVGAVRRLRRMLQTQRIEVLYCTGGPVASAIGSLATVNLPAVRLIWNLLGLPEGTSWHLGLQYLLLRAFRVLVSPTVPLLISCSEAVQARAQAVGYRCQRLCVIYPGVDTESFRPSPEGGALLRNEWGIAPDKKLIGLVGRLDPVKGHPVFLEAAGVLATKRSDLAFVCVGDGPEPYRRELRSRTEELGLGECLIWAGPRAYDDMPDVYNALDLLCLSSHSEGLVNVIGEAMACGVPCVATAVGGVPEIIGNLGIVVPPGDPAALARGVLEALRANPKPDELRQHIIGNFSLEAMVEATERELGALTRSDEGA